MFSCPKLGHTSCFNGTEKRLIPTSSLRVKYVFISLLLPLFIYQVQNVPIHIGQWLNNKKLIRKSVYNPFLYSVLLLISVF